MADLIMEPAAISQNDSKSGQLMIEDTTASTVTLKLTSKGLPLIPQPSESPFDPLNFSSWRKFMILVVLFVWSGVGAIHMVPVAPAFSIIAGEFGMSETSVTYLVGAPLLAYGVASLIWVAAGNRYGVRVVFLFTTATTGLFCVWAAKSQSAASLIAARTLASIVSASPETLGPQAVADVFFLKDRATCMSLIVLSQAGAFPLGSLMGAYITSGLGWRWIEWVVAIIAFVSFVLVLFFFPETQYTGASTLTRKRQPTMLDSFRLWSVSGGGRSKVDRCAYFNGRE